MRQKNNKGHLVLWQQRLARAKEEHDSLWGEAADRREKIYRGERKEIDPVIPNDKIKTTTHVRNIAMELIESMVSTSIPMPKVRAKRQQDQGRARLIEDMLRAELDRLRTEELIDMAERTVPIQGGCGWLVEWDPAQGTHTEYGDVSLSLLHPKTIYPQPGVYTGVEDMEWIITAVPQTRGYLERKYGVELAQQEETEPALRGVAEQTPQEDLRTQYIAYYRNGRGGIGLFSWCGDTVLQDLTDYQAHRLRRCAKCGAPQRPAQPPLGKQSVDGTYPLCQDVPAEQQSLSIPARDTCSFCGCRQWTDSEEDYEAIYLPQPRGFGMPPLLPEQSVAAAPDAQYNTPVLEPLWIPRYKPDVFPIVLQKNTSVYGRLFGESDIDKIADQQNTTNRLSVKILEKLLGAGSYLTLPNDATIRVDSGEMKVIRLENPADKAMIDVHTTQGEIAQDMAYLRQVYEEARQTLGITYSYQGQSDNSAQSGKAKEIQARQSAGRLQSKRVMKEAAFAKLFELIFKFKLAYTTEPRPVPCRDANGEQSFTVFNRLDFLEQDEAGTWYWNDAFLFSCDEQTQLAEDRTAMIEQTRQSFLGGAFGDPADMEVQLHYWRLMESLHYPAAAETVAFLQARETAVQTTAMAGQGCISGEPPLSGEGASLSS